MKFEFKMGVLVTTFFLVNIHMFLLAVTWVVAYKVESLSFILNVASMAYAAISVLGHVRASWTCMAKMHDPNVLGKPLKDPQNLKEAIDMRRNPVILGFVWRCKKEWEYIKKTASFDFRFE